MGHRRILYSFYEGRGGGEISTFSIKCFFVIFFADVAAYGYCYWFRKRLVNPRYVYRTVKCFFYLCAGCAILYGTILLCLGLILTCIIYKNYYLTLRWVSVQSSFLEYFFFLTTQFLVMCESLSTLKCILLSL